MGLSSIIRFNTGLLTFVKFVEVLKSGTVKTDLMYFLFFQPEDMQVCLNFTESQSMHAY